MSKLSEALEQEIESVTSKEIFEAIKFQMYEDNTADALKDITHSREATWKFEEITILWISELANASKNAGIKADENGSIKASKKNFKAAAKVFSNSMFKAFITKITVKPDEFTATAKEVVELFKHEPEEVQNDWSRFAMFMLQTIGAGLKAR